MGRYTGPRNKIARRFGVNLGLKSNPTKVARRLSQMPGVHGAKKRAGITSTYGKQLNEKQKVKYIYGLRERQLRGYVNRAEGQKGNSAVTLQKLLERRMDNMIYRAGFAVTRAQARQLVNHGMFTVNGKKMDIPSYSVKVGDIIELKENKRKKKYFANIADTLAKTEGPSWLALDAAKCQVKVTSEPEEKDFDKIFDIKIIIEYYSSR